MNKEDKARELYPDWEPHSKKIDSLGVIVVMAERQAFLKGYEYANQQPEVDYKNMFANCSLPNEKQPEQGEVDALAEKLHDEYERLSYIEGWSTQKDCQVGFENLPDANQRVMRRMAEFVLSTLTQDKVREAAEKVVCLYDSDCSKTKDHERVFDEAIDELRKALNQNKQR